MAFRKKWLPAVLAVAVCVAVACAFAVFSAPRGEKPLKAGRRC